MQKPAVFAKGDARALQCVCTLHNYFVVGHAEQELNLCRTRTQPVRLVFALALAGRLSNLCHMPFNCGLQLVPAAALMHTLFSKLKLLLTWHCSSCFTTVSNSELVLLH